ncbi:MAG: Cu(I)/Ag(I) efflux system membrane fusion protein, partial [Rhodothermales bacterium]
VTSAQFLLDSEASLAGSIVRLDQAEDSSGPEVPVTAFGSGWIEEINTADRRLRVMHGPISALSWPAMNMIFEVDPEVELASFEVGQDIRFQLRQAESGRFIIARAYLPDDNPNDGDQPND